MPNINSIPEVLYEPNQPYHYIYDNLPLRNILTRIGLVNIQVDTNSDIIRGAAGTAGTIDARLNISLEPNGSLKTSAVDSSEHGIGHHSDGEGPDGVHYVRMTADERAKLGLVQPEANKIVFEVEDSMPTVGDAVVISEGAVRLKGSSTIFFDFESPNVIRAHSAFPPDAAHRHHYGLKPADSNPSEPDYKNFKTTSIATPYEEGSLRVYVNGVRLCSVAVPVPSQSTSSSSSSGLSLVPTYIQSEDHQGGTFVLNRSLNIADVVRIDFDETFAPSQDEESPSSSSSS
jgi:hypothetical protein